MKQITNKPLKIFLGLFIAALCFGTGTVYGVHLTFSNGSDYIAKEMEQRNMDFAPFSSYLETDTKTTKTPEHTVESTGDTVNINQSSDLLDLNSATVEELDAIYGISKETAEKIVAYREKFGTFNNIEDLTFIEGISTRAYNILKTKVEVTQ